MNAGAVNFAGAVHVIVVIAHPAILLVILDIVPRLVATIAEITVQIILETIPLNTVTHVRVYKAETKAGHKTALLLVHLLMGQKAVSINYLIRTIK